MFAWDLWWIWHCGWIQFTSDFSQEESVQHWNLYFGPVLGIFLGPKMAHRPSRAGNLSGDWIWQAEVGSTSAREAWIWGKACRTDLSYFQIWRQKIEHVTTSTKQISMSEWERTKEVRVRLFRRENALVSHRIACSFLSPKLPSM